MLINAGADVNIQDKYGCAPIHTVALHGTLRESNLDFAKLLIANGADINIKDKNGATLLHYALRDPEEKSTAMIELLIDNGADASIKDSGGCTPLDEVEHRGQKDVIELLRKHTAKE